MENPNLKNKIKDAKGIALISLIGIIVGIIIIVSIVVILVFRNNGEKNENTNNEVETEQQEDDPFFEPEEDDNKNKEEDVIPKDYENKEGVKITEIYDSTGEESNKLHIGDFVDYTAGKWTESQINKIDANGKQKKPSKAYQFGGYVEGMSRDGSVVPANSEYSYIKEEVDGETRTIRGWRVFDINDDEITLISAGCPEDYYHPAEGRSAYISQYILTGEVNSNINAEWLELGTKYKTRTWEEYVNSEYYATKASALSKTKLDEWYSKYIEPNADTWKNLTFQKIYGTKYENLIDNNSYFWLQEPYNLTNIYGFFPNARAIGNSTNKYGNVFGIRVLAHLPAEIKFKEEPIGTKTVISQGENYTYNIWEISR